MFVWKGKEARGDTVFEEKERQQKDPVWGQGYFDFDKYEVRVDPDWEQEEPDWSDQQQIRWYVKEKLDNMSKWLDHFAKWQKEQDKDIDGLSNRFTRHADWNKSQDEEIKVITGRLDAQAKKIADLEKYIEEVGVINLHTEPDPPSGQGHFILDRSNDLSTHICHRLFHGGLKDLPGERRNPLWGEIELAIREWAAKEEW